MSNCNAHQEGRQLRTLRLTFTSTGCNLSFATSPQDFVEIALRGAIRKVGKPLHYLNRQDKIAIIGMLEQAEVIRFSQSVEIVMAQLGVSRTSIYAYLKEIRGETEVPVG